MAPRLGSLGRGGHGPRTALPDRALLSGCASAARRRAHPPLLGGASAARRSRLGRVLRCVLGCSPALARSRCAHPRPLLGWLHTRLPLGCASAAPALRPPCSSWLLCALAAPAFLWPRVLLGCCLVCSSAAVPPRPLLGAAAGPRLLARGPALAAARVLCGSVVEPLGCLVCDWRVRVRVRRGGYRRVLRRRRDRRPRRAGRRDGRAAEEHRLLRAPLTGLLSPLSLPSLWGGAPHLPRSRDPSALAVRRAASVFCRLLAVRQAF